MQGKTVVSRFFNFPEAKKEACRGLERGRQLAAVTQQVKAEGKSFRSGPGHEDLLGHRWELSSQHTDVLPPQASVSALHLLPAFQTHVMK